MDVNAGPFDLHPERRRAVLLIHGFTGTPYEMRYLAERLAARDLRAVGPLLPGHGLDAAALNRTTWRDWLAAMERELGALLVSGPVAVVGMSLGGLLAIELARGRSQTELAALCLLGTPLWLPPATVFLTRAAAKFGRIANAVPKLGGSDIRDRAVKADFPSLATFPLAALGSLIDLQPLARAHVPEVTVPTLVMHAVQDHVAPFACARELHERLGTADKRYVPLPRSYHIITVDVERERVAREVGDFIAERIR